MSNVKSKVLTELEKNRGDYFSGESLAKSLGVTRSAVNKAIKTLIKEGYSIDAITNRGYALNSLDILSAEGVKSNLNEKYQNVNIKYYKEIDSTNNEAKREIYTATMPTIYLADCQTAGRGRMGREFFSPPKESVYISFLVKPNTANGLKITSCVAVAVSNAIEAVTTKKTEIKWVNDIYIDGKKAVGILCEGVTGFENGEIEAVVIGIGVNCKIKDFPIEIKDTATNVLDDEKATRNELTAKIIENVLDYLENIDTANYMQEYREKSMIIGCDISFTKNGEINYARVDDIDDNGALIVNMNGEIRMINSGEVTVRKV